MNYLAEVRLRIDPGSDLSWIRKSLEAACRRIDRAGPHLKILSAVHAVDDGRLLCIIKATDREEVQRLFQIALLPSARVVEVVDV